MQKLTGIPRKNLSWCSDSLPTVTWLSLFMCKLGQKLVLLGARLTYQRNTVLGEKEEHLFSGFSDCDWQGYKEKKEFLYLPFFGSERQIVWIAVCPLMKASMSQLSGDRIKFSDFYDSNSELLSPRCGELDSCILLCKVVLKNIRGCFFSVTAVVMVQIRTESSWLSVLKWTVELLQACTPSQTRGETPTWNFSDCWGAQIVLSTL